MAEVQAGVKCNYDITSPEIAGFIADQTEVSFKDVYMKIKQLPLLIKVERPTIRLNTIC